MATTIKCDFREIDLALKRLTIFRSLREEDPVIVLFEELLEGILAENESKELIFDKYHQLLGKILEQSLVTAFPSTGNPWQDYLLDRLLLLEKSFVFQLAIKGVPNLAKPIADEIKKDLLSMQALFNLGAKELESGIKNCLGRESWEQISPYWQFTSWGNKEVGESFLAGKISDPILELKLKLYEKHIGWDKHLEMLAKHYKKFGIGKFGIYHAFRFQKNNGEGILKPIPLPDPIKLADLIGYQKQREQVVRNTTQFICGFPANNLLLYGDRGTGKSSTIKALVHEFGPKGLRMIEMTKLDLKELPTVLDAIRHRNHRFIIFIDDLSFEEGEDDFKHLKAVLEGSLEMRPEQVLIYATSNRRHLIKERFSDREWTGDEEVRVQDTLQEKLSLGDRFGMTITFTSPDQDQYLEIVEGLAKQEGLDIELELLREKALKWALWHNGRSGRTARQFVDDLIGRMGMKNGD